MSEIRFLDTLNAKLRSHDAYGVWKNLDDATIISRHFVMSRQEKKKIDVYGRMPPETVAKIRLFYEAVAQTAEARTGRMAITVIDINTEGFGRALVVYEDRILLADILRNAHKFGFETIEKLEETGEKLVDICVKKIGSL